MVVELAAHGVHDPVGHFLGAGLSQKRGGYVYADKAKQHEEEPFVYFVDFLIRSENTVRGKNLISKIFQYLRQHQGKRQFEHSRKGGNHDQIPVRLYIQQGPQDGIIF